MDIVKELTHLQVAIGYNFKNPDLLVKAITHSSFAFDHKSLKLDDYERLEFFGDAVLQLAITEMLYNKYPQADEGMLTRMRTALINRYTLHQVALNIGLNKAILLGGGAGGTGENAQINLISSVMESLIAAVYIDGGYSEVNKVLKPLFSGMINNPALGDVDPKTELQELANKKFKSAPTYTIVGEKGPAHERVFVVRLDIAGHSFEGEGRSKKHAEKAAAGKALPTLRN